jgi:hypothetical protein
MPLDFSDMLDEAGDAVLHPRDIFFTLNRAPSFTFPRDIQTEVMNRWFDDRDIRLLQLYLSSSIVNGLSARPRALFPVCASLIR